MIAAEEIKKLRDLTGVSMSICKSALEEAAGDHEKALDILRAKGATAAEKKSIRTLGAGTIAAYVHSNKTIAAMVELASETDFVAKNEEFKSLAHDIAMHISATGPIDLEALYSEQYIKDPSLTIKDLIQGAVQKFGERVELVRFTRFAVGG
jgi:elongation factor Ts